MIALVGDGAMQMNNMAELTQYAKRLTSPWIGFPAASILCGLLAGFAVGFRSRLHCLPLFAALGVFVLAFGLVLAVLYTLIIPTDLTLKRPHPAQRAKRRFGFNLHITRESGRPGVKGEPRKFRSETPFNIIYITRNKVLRSQPGCARHFDLQHRFQTT